MEITRDEEFAMFDSAVQAIENTNVLMVNLRFDELLKLIAYNNSLKSCVADCYKTIDYEQLLKSCFEKKDGKHTIKLPDSKKALVAFVTKLIYEFHIGTQLIEKLLLKLYPELTPKASFAAFCEDVLNPYREAFRCIFMYDENVEHVDTDELPISDINPAVITEISAIAGEMRTEIEGDNKISETERKNFFELINGFCYAIEAGMPRLVRPGWLGMSIALNSSKKCASKLARMEALLSRYMLI